MSKHSLFRPDSPTVEASVVLFSLETLIITVSAGAVAALVVGFVTGFYPSNPNLSQIRMWHDGVMLYVASWCYIRIWPVITCYFLHLWSLSSFSWFCCDHHIDQHPPHNLTRKEEGGWGELVQSAMNANGPNMETKSITPRSALQITFKLLKIPQNLNQKMQFPKKIQKQVALGQDAE